MTGPHDPSIRSGLAPMIDSDTVLVLVGAIEYGFTVHEAPLRAHSRFFDAAMSGAWKESSKRIVKLPMENAAIFNVYVQWAYTSKISIAENWSYDDFLSLYLTACRLQDGDLQDATIDCIITQRQPPALISPNENDVSKIYNNTAIGNAARRLFVDIWTSDASEEWLVKLCDNVAAQFYFDLAKALIKMNAGRAAPLLVDKAGSTCKYHQHKEGECYSKKFAV
ncbi:unnamed protein product [Zymoseptoria tritici ST99CH_3D7]|uniref:BTB domain-containing protein n=1 Tax=Zymoseptoria tritici (strain ST99CH_3D7) TaxID=1276538 RepID=A0A1X7S6L1_ZYMT9|nr:unnamed protein product [Zymoseptoria tritici ST99CH_3D7]